MIKNFFYSSNPEEKKIKVWKIITSQKKLNLIQTINIEGCPQPIFINTKKKILYVSIRPNFKVIVFKIKNNGMINKIGETKLLGSSSYIINDIENNFFFSASYNYNMVSISKIKKNGIPQKPYEILDNIQGCHSINFSLDNRLIFIPALLENCIYIYKITIVKSFLKLKFHKKIFSIIENSGPRHMVFYKNFFYSINEFNNTVDVWKIQKNDDIKHLQNINLTILSKKKFWAADIHINKRFLYTCDRYTSTISILKINKITGLLKLINYIKVEKQPREFSIDITGKYLSIVGQKSNFISLYSINQQNGKLNFLSRHFAGISPLWVSNFVIF